MIEIKALHDLDIDATHAVPVTFAGVTVTALMRLNQHEHDRRTQVGLHAVNDRDLLNVLAELPLEHPVPWASLDPLKHSQLDTAPPGVVRDDAHGVTRVWSPAVQVEAVLRNVTNWRSDLRAVSMFAPDAPRFVVCRAAPPNEHPLYGRSRRLGVGMLESEEGSALRVILEPEPFPVAPTERHWRFLEAVYEAFLRSAASTPA